MSAAYLNQHVKLDAAARMVHAEFDIRNDMQEPWRAAEGFGVGYHLFDAESGTLYVVAATRVGNGFMQRLHALDLATGADRATSPVTITAPGFDPLMQNQRPGLLLSRGKVYIGCVSL